MTAYIGQGAPRFYLAMSPELPDPSFAKLVVFLPAMYAIWYRIRVPADADDRDPEASTVISYSAE
ncbi:hypothetical protein [Cupriavidus necator]|uniref:hypothetical protein n=1 Tax=Cupriavidus necator TaxID=106590 RepID=UPI00339D4D9F